MVNSNAATALGREQTDLLLAPPLANVDLLHWHAFERAIDAGYQHAQQALAALDEATRARLGVGTD